jgi:hypothetical protein
MQTQGPQERAHMTRDFPSPSRDGYGFIELDPGSPEKTRSFKGQDGMYLRCLSMAYLRMESGELGKICKVFSLERA